MADLIRSDPDFEAFCLNHFPDIQRRFSRAMERTEKENLLLLHASQQAEIWAALRKDYPESAVWPSFPPAVRPDVKSSAERTRFPTWLGLVVSLGAVSYTHLDVYKRQAVHGQPFLALPLPLTSLPGPCHLEQGQA